MLDSAKGPSAGIIFQFEIALLELAQIGIDESISIEKMDDIAKEDENGTYICTIQAKHSITLSGTNFGSTSDDLWKTMNIWISKIKSGILKEKNEFIAITNKKVPSNSIIRIFNQQPYDEVLMEIKYLKQKQEVEYQKKIHKKGKGHTIKKTIDRIGNVLANPVELKIIIENFKFRESIETKEEFLNKINMGTLESNEKKDFIYQIFLGWITDSSKESWKNQKDAVFSKKQFEKKFRLIVSDHTLVEGIFRTKKQIQTNNFVDIGEVNRNQLFIKQLQEIERPFNDEIIKDAIIDFILADIEIAYLITNKNGTFLTKYDFKDFEDRCEDKWNNIKKKHIRKNIEAHSNEELSIVACNIYDEIMQDVILEFQDSEKFNDSNRYIQNGTFLRLSNSPKIGWRPDWEKLYK